jgi:hypothetical protein
MLIKGRVLLDELFLVFGHILERVNRLGGAGWDAGSAVDATFGIHIHLSGGFETGLVLLGMNTVGWADLDTEGVFDTGISNYISHDEWVSAWNELICSNAV